MNSTFGALGVDLLVVGGAGIATLTVVLGLRRSLDLLPLPQDTRTNIARAFPVISVILVVAYCLFSITTFFGDYPAILPIALLVVLVAFGLAFWSVARDTLFGIFLRVEGSCQVGQKVRIGSISGRVVSLGSRAMSLETQEGDIAVIPYGSIGKDAIVRTSSAEQPAAHSLTLPLPSEGRREQLIATVHRAALENHWASVAREPEIRAMGEHLHITVYALDAQHIPDVEKAVTSAHRKATQETEPPAERG